MTGQWDSNLVFLNEIYWGTEDSFVLKFIDIGWECYQGLLGEACFNFRDGQVNIRDYSREHHFIAVPDRDNYPQCLVVTEHIAFLLRLTVSLICCQMPN